MSIDDKKHFVYWIRDDNAIDEYSEGYVGVTSNLKRRLSQHKYCCKNINKTYNKNMIDAFNSSTYFVDILFEGTKYDCYEKEHELRPNYDVGWNTRCGASSKLKTRDCKVSSAYRRVRHLSKKNDVSVCGKWKTTEGFYDFEKFYLAGICGGELEMVLPKNGEVSEKTILFLNRSDLVIASYRNIDFFGNGEMISNSELAELLNFEKANTLATQRSSGWSFGKIFIRAWEADRLRHRNGGLV